MAAVPIAVRAKSRLAQAERFLHQTRRWRAASVRHVAATIDQMMVTQLMAGGSGQWPVAGDQWSVTRGEGPVTSEQSSVNSEQ